MFSRGRRATPVRLILVIFFCASVAFSEPSENKINPNPISDVQQVTCEGDTFLSPTEQRIFKFLGEIRDEAF